MRAEMSERDFIDQILNFTASISSRIFLLLLKGLWECSFFEEARL